MQCADRVGYQRVDAMDGMSDTLESQGADWGAFGRPIFQDPEARALSRVGVIDVGSNSVRLVVFALPLIFTTKKSCAAWAVTWVRRASCTPKAGNAP